MSTPWEALCVDLVSPYTLIGLGGSATDFTVLTMKTRNVGMCLISIYVFIFAYKIFRFNSFMNEMRDLA